MSQPRTLLEKIWDDHVVVHEPGSPAVLYIDLHLVHEVTSPQGFDLLREKGIGVRRPEGTLATLDHSTPTLPPDANGKRPYYTEQAHRQVQTLRDNCKEYAIEIHDWDSPYRGIVHVMGPEMGATQPGMTIVCGDSHTSTHGAFGALLESLLVVVCCGVLWKRAARVWQQVALAAYATLQVLGWVLFYAVR